MKSNKELVYDFIKRYSNSLTAQEDTGVTTLYLAEKLGMQRTNISSILNTLVQEGLVEKINGRPVKYCLKDNTGSNRSEMSCFRNCIGYNSSLKNAVQLAKAAILYPHQSLHTLIVGPNGSGKSYFAQLMVQFAKDNGIIHKEKSFLKFNCRNYMDDEKQMVHMLFGEKQEGFENYFDRAGANFLFIDHVNLLPSYIRDKLFHYIETQEYYYLDSKKPQYKDVRLICTCNDDVNKLVLEHYSHKIPIKILLPGLSGRSLEERFQLIQHFFMLESLRIHKKLGINSEVLRCLLLYDCPNNVKQLGTDIQVGCANAFVRECQNNESNLNIYISDFNPYVRKGFLSYRKYQQEVEKIIPQNYGYSFNGSNVIINELLESQLKKNNIYDTLTAKVKELEKRGIHGNDISLILSVELDSLFKSYRTKLTQEVVNKEQLSKLVDSKIIDMVENFLKEASLRFNTDYPASVFYGLCLHLNSAVKRSGNIQSISNNQIMEMIENHKEKYSFSLQFALSFEEQLQVNLPIEEVVFITMFLCDQTVEKAVAEKPSVLIAMHGDSTASSIADVVNTLGKASNTYSFDLSLDKNSDEAYEELKKKVTGIDRGKGVVVIYDMGSIKTMCELIAQETNTEIRMIYLPVTLIALSCSRKAAFEEDIDKLARDHMYEVKSFMEEIDIKPVKECVVTLCNTGEGGAVQLKEYIEKYTDRRNLTVIALAVSDRKELIKRVDQIMAEYHIQAFIGTFDPQLYRIPFISNASLLQTDPTQLGQLLQPGVSASKDVDYKAIYEYLDAQLEFVDIEKIKRLLPKIMREIREVTDNNLDENEELGLFIHIACAINRIKGNGKLPANTQKEIIFNKYENVCMAIIKIFKQVEKSFGIIFSDDEIANVVAIIKKL